MAKKKKTGLSDAAAGFFGDDDLDWLDDDEEEDAGAAAAAREADDDDDDDEAPAEEPSDAGDDGEEQAAAPTLTFSAMPTIPAPDDTSEALADMTTAVEKRPELQALTEEVPEAPPEPRPEPAPSVPSIVLPAAPPPPPPSTEEADDTSAEAPDEEVVGDELQDGPGGPTPLVRTHDPAPVRVGVAPGATATARTTPAAGSSPVKLARKPSFTPPLAGAPAAASRPYVPRGERDSWREAATALTRESALREGEARGRLLMAAARVHQRRLGDDAQALKTYREANEAGLATPELYRRLAGAAARTGDIEESRRYLSERMGSLEGGALADAQVAMASLLREAEDAEGALERARAAFATEPDNYMAMSLLRDLLPKGAEGGEERARLLGRMGELVGGALAAEALWEQGRILQLLGKLDEAQAAFEKALAAHPGHEDASVGLEGLLVERGDVTGLAAFYAAEADRSSEHDAGWWRLQAARTLRQVGDVDGAAPHYHAAAEAGYTFALGELEAALLAGGSHAALVTDLVARAPTQTGTAAACDWFQAGWLRERHLEDPAGAWEAYVAALSADGAAIPALDGALRLLRTRPDVGSLDALSALALSADATAILARRAVEAAELGAEPPLEALRTWQSETADATTRHYANASLWVALTRQGRWSERVDHIQEMARSLEGPARGWWLLLAATSGPPGEGVDPEVRADLLKQALAADADNEAALLALEAASTEAGQYAEAAQARLAASQLGDDPAVQAHHAYRAAVLWADRADDPGSARAALERCLTLRPGYPVALTRLHELVPCAEEGVHAARYTAQAEAAERPDDKAWLWFAGAITTPTADGRDQLDRILEVVPDHPGAKRALEVQCLASADTTTLSRRYEDSLGGITSSEEACLALRLAELAFSQTRPEEGVRVLEMLAAAEVAGPRRAAARVAQRMGHPLLAISLLENLNDVDEVAHRAELLTRADRPGEAVAILRPLLGQGAVPVHVSLVAAEAGRRAADHDTVARAMTALATSAEHPSARAAFAAWGAEVHERQGRGDDALPLLLIALENRPESDDAFYGAVRELAEAGRVEELKTTYAAHRPDDLAGLAEGLETAEELAMAAGVLAQLVERIGADDDAMAPLIDLEFLNSRIGEWQPVFDALVKRRAISRDEDVLAAIDSKRRWVLAEKLASTDAAWDLYRQLHEETPDDREVTENLARIAGARGDAALAVTYLKELAETASDATEAAQYQRRIGEVREMNGDVAGATQAYLDALDHVRDDREALDGLRRLAEQDKDWPRLVAVLQREVGIAESPSRRLQLKRDIARVTEDELGDGAVAIDAWRAVLEDAPDDAVALGRLVELAATEGDWGTFVEFGTTLAAQLSPDEAATMHRRLGIACLEHLDKDDAIKHFEQAIAGPTPDLDAAGRLELLYRPRADWNGALRALGVLVTHAPTDTERLAPLTRIGRIERDVRHDKESAAAAFAKVLAIDPDQIEAMRFLASYYFETQQFDQALPICERLEPTIETDQDLEDFDVRMEMSTFYFTFAEMLRAADRGPEALTRYERALELNPAHLASLEAVGPLYTAAEKWRDAERVYRQLLQLTGGHGDRAKVASTYTELGLVERELEHHDKAYKRFNKALELSPNHVGALKGMALVLEDREEWSNLLNIFNNIIYHATVPQDVIDAYMIKGRVLDDHMARPDKAAQHYMRSLDFDASQPLAFLRLSELAMRRDDYAEAGRMAQKGLDLEATVDIAKFKPMLLVCLAASQKADDNVEEAALTLKAAAVLDEDLPGTLPDDPLADLEKLRQHIKDQLPRQ